MKDLLSEFLPHFEKNETYQRELLKYDKALNTEEWRFMVASIRMIQGKMLEHMFSKDYTGLDITEKDVVQRTYYNINQILGFLLEPRKWIDNRSKWKQNLSNLMGKVNPNQRKGQ